MANTKLYSDKFSEILVEAIIRYYLSSGKTTLYFFGDFRRTYVHDLCEITKELPDDGNVELWVKQLINTLNCTKKRSTFLAAMNKLIIWRDTEQGHTFWYVIYDGMAAGLDLCWFGEKEALQVALDGTWGEAFGYIWEHASALN